MKKCLFLVLAICLAVLTSCASPLTDQNAAPESDSTAAAAPDDPGATTFSNAKPGSTKAATAKPSEAPQIYSPHEVLSAEEASSLVGYSVKLDPGTLFSSTDLGYVSERYVYDIPSENSTSTTTIHALVQIMQNGMITPEALAKGHDALWNFDSEKEFSADEIMSIPGLGMDAFYFTGTSQVHVIFQDYYIIVAFEKDPYDASKNYELNEAIAARILENMSLASLT